MKKPDVSITTTIVDGLKTYEEAQCTKCNMVIMQRYFKAGIRVSGFETDDHECSLKS